MFTNAYQSGFLSILYSIGSKPLQIWDKQSTSFSIRSSKWAHKEADRSGYPIVRPWNYGHQRHNSLHHLPCRWEADPRHQIAFLGHDHQECNPNLTQLKKYFTFEVQVLDDKNVRRRFRASNYQSTTRVKPFICTMPMRLDEGRRYLTQVGTRSSSICQTSLVGHTAPTTLKLWESPSTPIVESAGFTSLIGSTARKNSHQSSSSSSQSRNNNETGFHLAIGGLD